jgi:hypothetical protein
MSEKLKKIPEGPPRIRWTGEWTTMGQRFDWVTFPAALRGSHGGHKGITYAGWVITSLAIPEVRRQGRRFYLPGSHDETEYPESLELVWPEAKWKLEDIIDMLCTTYGYKSPGVRGGVVYRLARLLGLTKEG